MNTITHTVTKVLTKPYHNNMWCVDVEADSWGSINQTTVYLKTKEEADLVDIGYQFEA